MTSTTSSQQQKQPEKSKMDSVAEVGLEETPLARDEQGSLSTPSNADIDEPLVLNGDVSTEEQVKPETPAGGSSKRSPAEKTREVKQAKKVVENETEKEKKEDEMTISVSEFGRMQQELLDLKSIKYEGEIKEKKLKKEFGEKLKNSEDRLKELHKDNGLLRKKVDTLETEKNSVNRDLKNLKTEFELKSKTLNDGMVVLTDDNVVLKQQLDLLKAKFEEEKRDLEEKENVERKLKVTIEGLHTERSDLEKQLADVNERFFVLEKECAMLRQKSEEASKVETRPLSEISNANGDRRESTDSKRGSQTENELNESENVNEEFSAKIRELEIEAEKLKDQLSVNQTELETREKENSSLKQKYDYLMSNCTDLEGKLDEKENEFTEYRGKYNETLLEKVKELGKQGEAELSEKEGEIKKLTETIGRLNEQIQAQRQENNAANVEIKKCHGEIDSQRAKYKKREADHQKAISDLRLKGERNMISTEKRLNEDMKDLIESEKKALAERAEFEKKYDVIFANKEQMEQQMNTMRDCVASTEHELDEKIKVIEHLTKQKNEFGNAAHTAEQKVVELEAIVKELEYTKNRIEEVEKKNEELMAEIQSVKANASSTSQENTKYVMRANELQARVVELEANCAEVEGNMAKEKELNEHLSVKNSNLLEQEAELKESLHNTQSSLQEELAYMTSQLSEEAGKAEKLEKELDELSRNNKLTEKRLTLRIKELKKELGRKQNLSVSEGSSVPNIVTASSSAEGNVGSMTHGKDSRRGNQEATNSEPRLSKGKSFDSITSEVDLSSRRGSIQQGSIGDNSRRSHERVASAPVPKENYPTQPPLENSPQPSPSGLRNPSLPSGSKKEADASKLRSKIRFYEENTKTLVEDIQRKSKIIQMYILREEAGTLSEIPKPTATSGKGKIKSITSFGDFFKASKDPSPSSKSPPISQELAVQISKKTQMVLEDVILKNIQLQENLDTLATELAKTRRY
eukprot:Nk52_evm6s326 gene=Nk52_evmTU6s326